MADIVLVTEASGYTGSHIVDHLLRDGYRVRGTVKPERVSALRIAYLEYQDRFEAVGVTDLDHDDLTDLFRGVSILIVASSPPIRGRTIEEARSTVESASSGTKHILEYAQAAGVKKIVYTGSFQNTFHPNDSWNPITITEDVLPGFTLGPYGRGQAIDQHRYGTFAWVSELLNGPPGRPMIPNAPPFSPNYVHVADVARAHVAALRVGPLDPPRRRKRVLLVAGYVLWPEVVAHLSEAMPGIRERLPSLAGGPGPRQVSSFARFETRNAREMLGIEEYKGWKEAIEDAVKDMLRVESRMMDL
ncbi:NAD-P-binding protein [Lactarius psammicola]|nr:NAD-P-binding protein [Lactarius psammicola]